MADETNDTMSMVAKALADQVRAEVAAATAPMQATIDTLVRRTTPLPRLMDATSGRQLGGVPRCHIEYEYQRTGESDSGGIFEDGDRGVIWDKDYAREALKIGDAKTVCLDIEHAKYRLTGVWSGSPSDERIAENRKKYIEIVKVARAVLPGDVLLTGYDVGVPAYSIHSLSAKANEVEAYAELHAEIIKHLDAVTISLYDRSDRTLDDWIERAAKKADFARRFGKPIIGLIWHKHHDEHVDVARRGNDMPLEQWRGMLAWCADNLDSTAIWSKGEIPASHLEEVR